MTTRVVQDPMLTQLMTELDVIDEEVRVLREKLRGDDLERAAAGGGWTVAQVFEHLIIANTHYYDAMEKALTRNRGASGSAKWRPTLFGRLLVNSLSPRSTRRLPAPRIFRPGPEPRVDVVQSFLDSQERFRSLARKADGLELARVRMSSPVSPLIRVNIGDAFRIIIVHEQRHLQQVRRILGA